MAQKSTGRGRRHLSARNRDVKALFHWTWSEDVSSLMGRSRVNTEKENPNPSSRSMMMEL